MSQSIVRQKYYHDYNGVDYNEPPFMVVDTDANVLYIYMLVSMASRFPVVEVTNVLFKFYIHIV